MKKSMMTFEVAKAYIKDKGLRTEVEYKNWWLVNREENIEIGLPQHPDKYYKKVK